MCILYGVVVLAVDAMERGQLLAGLIALLLGSWILMIALSVRFFAGKDRLW
jgi:hypothetical protein